MLIQSQESTCARRKKPVRMGNERFCSLFASVLRINVICTNTVYSIKERKMYTYRQSTIKSNSLLVYYLVGLLLGGIGVALILLFSILAVMDLLRGGFATPALESSIYLLWNVLYLLLLVLALVWGSRHYRHWKRIEPRRLAAAQGDGVRCVSSADRDRKSTRLNSTHQIISYAVFCFETKTPSTVVICSS